MGFRHFALSELAGLRRRGNKPADAIVIGDKSAALWAEKNKFFFVPVFDLDGDLTPFSGLHTIVRMARPSVHREAIQRLALNAELVTVFDTNNGHVEYL